MAIILLCTINTYAQPPCCSGGGAANVSLGGSSGSMLMQKGAFGLEVTNVIWLLRQQQDTHPWLTPVADVQYVNSTVIGLHYGILKNLSVSLTAPYIVIRSDVYSMEDTDDTNQPTVNSGSSRGLGDMSAMFRFQLPIKSVKLPKIALLAGVEMPTGMTHENNANSGAVVATMGSKTWDPIVGIGLKKMSKSERWSIALNTTYKISTENRDSLDFGDFWNTTLLGSFKVNKANKLDEDGKPKTSKWFQTVSAGLTNDFLFRQKYDGLGVFNTGYDRFFGSLGTSFGIKKRLTMSVFGDIPLLEHIKGQQNRSALRLRASLLITLNTN